MAQKLLDNWFTKVSTAVLVVVVLFLLNNWLESFKETTTGLQESVEANTVAVNSAARSLDSLRYATGDMDGDIIALLTAHKETLNDHEARIRGLERK